MFRWRAELRPFGDVQSLSSTIENNLRFPGQYFDSETGLHQNWFRDYAPKTGRYRAADPIGLAGGELSSFGYAHSNPTNLVDPASLWYFPWEAFDFAFSVQSAREWSRAASAFLDEPGWDTGLYAGHALVLATLDAGALALPLVPAVAGLSQRATRVGGAYCSRSAVGGAFEAAKAGGTHAGFLNNYAGRTPAELQKAIASIEKQIAEHQSWIANPRAKIPNFGSLDPRQQAALINSKWPGDIARQQDQIDILKGLLGGN